jgi:hypothetical protein
MDLRKRVLGPAHCQPVAHPGGVPPGRNAGNDGLGGFVDGDGIILHCGVRTLLYDALRSSNHAPAYRAARCRGGLCRRPSDARRLCSNQHYRCCSRRSTRFTGGGLAAQMSSRYGEWPEPAQHQRIASRTGILIVEPLGKHRQERSPIDCSTVNPAQVLALTTVSTKACSTRPVDRAAGRAQVSGHLSKLT